MMLKKMFIKVICLAQVALKISVEIVILFLDSLLCAFGILQPRNITESGCC